MTLKTGTPKRALISKCCRHLVPLLSLVKGLYVLYYLYRKGTILPPSQMKLQLFANKNHSEPVVYVLQHK